MTNVRPLGSDNNRRRHDVTPYLTIAKTVRFQFVQNPMFYSEYI